MPDLFVAHNKHQPTTKETLTPKKEPLAAKEKPAKTHVVNFLSYLTSEPGNIHFENQEKGEHIYLFVRKHPITNVPWIFVTLMLILLPALSPLILPLFTQSFFEIPERYIFVLLLFYYLIVFGYAFVSYVVWFYNVGLITNLRVVDLDVSHITHKNVAATSIQDIVDVEYNQGGFLSNFFNFGNVMMQTEGVKPNFEFLSVPKPARVADTISDLIRGETPNE